jgi:hypothetical protein
MNVTNKNTFMKHLKFSAGNAKLSKAIGIFSLPAGHSCPFANECLSKAVMNEAGKFKIVDGKNCQFRCYAATEEVRNPSVRNARQHNFNLLKGLNIDEMVDLIVFSLKATGTDELPVVRVHESGDFFNQDYFDAWMKVATLYPEIQFYAYTKSLPYWIARLNEIPANFALNASKGGRYDNLIEEYNLKFAEVVLSEEEAKVKGLEIDKTDKKAYNQAFPFALLIHGVQPAGSEASKALQALKKTGYTGYSSKK